MRVLRQLFKYSLGLTAPSARQLNATIHQADCVFVFISCYFSLSYSDSFCICCSIFLLFFCSISSCSSFSISGFSLNSRCICCSIFLSFSIYLYLPLLIFLPSFFHFLLQQLLFGVKALSRSLSACHLHKMTVACYISGSKCVSLVKLRQNLRLPPSTK